MLRRILLFRPSSANTDAVFSAAVAALGSTLTQVAARSWPGARVETRDVLQPDEFASLSLDAQDLLLVPAGEAQLLAGLEDAAKESGEAPPVVVLTTRQTQAPATGDGGLVQGALRLEESAPEAVTLAINNALAACVKAAFLRRLSVRGALPDAVAVAPAVAASAETNESPPTQVLARSGDGQLAPVPLPGDPSRADSLLNDFGAKAPGYRIISHLASGGVAEVFLAERIENGRAAVLKIIDRARCEDQSAVKRFIQEYTMISRISSPHVVEIFDRGFTPAYAFISMEYFPGGDLSHRIRDGIDPDTVVSYTRQIAAGLSEIHKHGIVHRDLKPGNVLFRDDGTAAITDFGIAKRLASNSDLTMEDTLMGTPYYIAPELLRGENCEISSDLYSLGVVFYEMLTGRKPYVASSLAGIISEALSAPLPQLEGALSRFQPILERLLSKKPEGRFKVVDELIEALAAPSLVRGH